jgi:hypothetical protein
MLKIRCKNCNIILESHPSKTRCCGCDNLTTIKGETITALDLSLVELITTNQVKASKSSFTREDLAYQEERRNRKVRKLEFEIR